MSDKTKKVSFVNDEPAIANTVVASHTVARRGKPFDPQEQDAFNMQMFQMQQMNMRRYNPMIEPPIVSPASKITQGGGGGGGSTGASSSDIQGEKGEPIQGEGAGGGTIKVE